MHVLLAFANLAAGPGFVQGLSGRWRAAIAWLVALLAAVVLSAFTIWGVVAVVGVVLASIADAALGLRRIPPPIRWNGLVAGGVATAAVTLFIMTRVLVLEAFKMPSSSMSPTYRIGDHIFADKLTVGISTPGRGEVIVFAQPCTPELDYIKRVIAVAGDTIEVRCSRVYINGTAVDESLSEARTQYEEYDERNAQWYAREVSEYRESLGGHTYHTFHGPDRPDRSLDDGRDFPGQVLHDCAAPMAGYEAPRAVMQAPGKLVETNAAPATACDLHRHYVVPADHVFVMGDNRANSNDSRYWGSVPVANIRGRVRGIWFPVGRFGSRD